jgi:hypothetical protein
MFLKILAKKNYITELGGKKNPWLATVKIRNVPWNELNNNVLFSSWKFSWKNLLSSSPKNWENFGFFFFWGHSANSNKVLEILAKKCIAQN